MSTNLQLNRLLQLCSANLPVGGFSFSQGLEYAVETGWVNNVQSCRQWIQFILQESLAPTDIAILQRLYPCLKAENDQQVEQIEYWNQHLLACRESKELRLADLAMGKALVRLLTKLEHESAKHLLAQLDISQMTFTCAFAIAAHAWELDLASCQSGFCWAFIDSQVAAATKLVPLGQTQAQQLLFELSEQVDAAIALAAQLSDEDIGGSLPRVAMASAWHETQYSRLFRS